jgi:Arc-like DNA binding domain
MAGRRTITQQRFRLREDLLTKLQRAAEANDRSLNEEVEQRLQASFTKDTVEKAVKAATAELIEQTAEATANATIDKPIEAELARSGTLNLAMFPPWMLVSWAKRHAEHPEAVRIVEANIAWLRQQAARRQEDIERIASEAAEFAREQIPAPTRKVPKGTSKK